MLNDFCVIRRPAEMSLLHHRKTAGGIGTGNKGTPIYVRKNERVQL
jgi:hypothetical protein